MLPALQTLSGKLVPFIATNPSITMLWRDTVRLDYRSVYSIVNECNASRITCKSQERWGLHNAIVSPNLTLNVIDCILTSRLSFSHSNRCIGETPARNQSRSSATLEIRSSPSSILRMHHQALKMKDGWRIKAIPKCQASAMAASVAETERLRRRRRRRRR